MRRWSSRLLTRKDRAGSFDASVLQHPGLWACHRPDGSIRYSLNEGAEEHCILSAARTVRPGEDGYKDLDFWLSARDRWPDPAVERSDDGQPSATRPGRRPACCGDPGGDQFSSPDSEPEAWRRPDGSIEYVVTRYSFREVLGWTGIAHPGEDGYDELDACLRLAARHD